MHTVKAQARKAARRAEDGAINLNPFARTLARRSNNDTERRAHQSPGARRAINATSTSAQSPPRQTNSVTGFRHAPMMTPSSTTPRVAGDESNPDKNGSDDRHVQTAMAQNARDEPGHLTQRRKYSPMRIVDNIRRKSNTYGPVPVVQQCRNFFLGSWINILLILVPVGFAVHYAKVEPGYVDFIVNFLAIIPLAGMLSFATEELARYCGDNLGGLLNATFGNAVEVIVSLIALLQNKIVIVQTSLIGSMLSNLLLVLGMAFFLGGWNRVEQHFNDAIAQTSPGLLAVAVGSLILPTAYHQLTGEGGRSGGNTTTAEQKSTQAALDTGVNQLSRATAVLLLVVYAAYLTFQLRTHKEYFNVRSPKSVKREDQRAVDGARASSDPANDGDRVASTSDTALGTESNSLQEEEEDLPQLTLIGALVALAGSTLLVAFCSEFMVSGIDAVSGSISEVFIGLILVPIVGNAAEHATAVTVAIKDKIGLSIGVAIGSSIQIALFVIPIMVCLGWWIPVEGMNLWFDGFQTTALFIAVFLVNYLIADGKSNWLEGLLLMVVYIVIAVAAWFSPTPTGLGGGS